MFEPWYQPDPRLVGMGLGFFRHAAAGHRVVGHDGILPGFHSTLFVAPDDGVGVLACTNGTPGAMTWLPIEVGRLLHRLLAVPGERVRGHIPTRAANSDHAALGRRQSVGARVKRVAQRQSGAATRPPESPRGPVAAQHRAAALTAGVGQRRAASWPATQRRWRSQVDCSRKVTRIVMPGRSFGSGVARSMMTG
jgi:hypothetical protein